MTLEKIFIPQLYLPVIYICVAILINGLFKRIIQSVIRTKLKKMDKSSFNYKRTETIATLISNCIKYIISIFTLLAILTVFGIDVSSVLAGLGIIGLILGLALQDFAKDIIAGISILLENQYAIGDYVSVGDFTGEVIFLGLKTTKIRSWDGKVKIIANHNITEIINYNMADSMAIVDIGVAYESDFEKVEKVLDKLVKKMTEELPNLRGEVRVLGVEQVADSSVVYRVVAPTVPMEHYGIQRLMRKILVEGFIKEGIKIPYTQIEVHDGK